MGTMVKSYLTMLENFRVKRTRKPFGQEVIKNKVLEII